ncbi:hypothetical protein [Burkholderia sp. IDO3]|uniref:hypothetical protein n=1 Tax=Burkholderia sp. IDO3 TaxID=1705310 RepID=UPI000BBA7F06|nr:hypothetical protein [Burkholderia sp. IDO3]AXK64739.1 hypothetical protein DCN14_18860 [Burkholderia sp. IDO3]PCD61298.1 hypothetical protein CN645_13295 [Burkholderia sp. IDO3]
MNNKYLTTIDNPGSIITAIDAAVRFPEILQVCNAKYAPDIDNFKRLVGVAENSADLLGRIRSSDFTSEQRMSLLKMFRRCVSPVLDTEMAKKITKVSTQTLVENLGHTFKAIEVLRRQFANLSRDEEAALAALIGEYDTRGQLGYLLTDRFFSWFEGALGNTFSIEGPRGAGRDIELSTVYSDYVGRFPCDFVIRSCGDDAVRAIGFARYDSTRGGAQSDDRTGGNSDKVSKAKKFCEEFGKAFRIIFVSDGPGLAHGDTWSEACELDGGWDGNVRVTTLKTAPYRVDKFWLMGTTGEIHVAH